MGSILAEVILKTIFFQEYSRVHAWDSTDLLWLNSIPLLANGIATIICYSRAGESFSHAGSGIVGQFSPCGRAIIH